MLSRIAKNGVLIPDGVQISLKGNTVTVKGKLGELVQDINEIVSMKIEDKLLTFSVAEESKFAKAMSGTAYSLIKNMIKGVTEGFEKKLSVLGVGYKASLAGQDLNLLLGYSHPIIIKAPQGITFKTPTPNEVVVSGSSKQAVGQIAAVIRSKRVVEPYKGKGIRYADEQVILKEAKKK